MEWLSVAEQTSDNGTEDEKWSGSAAIRIEKVCHVRNQSGSGSDISSTHNVIRRQCLRRAIIWLCSVPLILRQPSHCQRRMSCAPMFVTIRHMAWELFCSRCARSRVCVCAGVFFVRHTFLSDCRAQAIGKNFGFFLFSGKQIDLAHETWKLIICCGFITQKQK